jgi:hypothetical protein
MHKLLYLLAFILFFPFFGAAQNDTIHYNIRLSGLSSSGAYAPFWLQSRDYGTTPSTPQSATFLVGVQKNFDHPDRLFDYNFKVSGFLSTDNLKTNLYFQEWYAHLRLLVFDLVVGSREEQFGNQDQTLSSGGFLFSQNARPIPCLTVGIEKYTPVPFTRGYVEVKGAISEGVFLDNLYMKNVLFHHKYIYLRFGGNLPVHLQYNFDHAAQWGGINPNSNTAATPVAFKDFIDVFTGGHGGSDANRSDQINALGNHIISQGVRLDADISDFKIGAYWQNLLEDGPIRLIGFDMNTPDGLWGISIHNNRFPFINGILYEYLNTTDQSGPFAGVDGVDYGGVDGYFTNGSYPSGWSYYSRTIGTPFISSPLYTKNINLSTLNNRVQVHHIGIEGDILSYQYRFLTSFSKNYGNYYPPFPAMIQNTSMLLDVHKQFSGLSNIELGCSLGADFGKLYGNSVGIQFSIRKTGDLFSFGKKNHE